jgi:serine/threonine-protein kinase HipA
MAMKLGGKYTFREMQVRHWDRFAEAARLSQAQTRKRVVRMAGQLPSVAQQLQAEGAFRDQALINIVVSLIEERCALTLRLFNAG